MALFNDVFNKSRIYDMLFFNIKAVLIHPTLEDLKAKNPKMFERWKYISKVKFDTDFDTKIQSDGSTVDYKEEWLQKIYEENAVQYPEFVKIVAITYATAYNENNTLKRHLTHFINNDEAVVIEQFMEILQALSSDDMKSTPQSFSILCGHNIIAHDIPLLMKRFMVNRSKFQKIKNLPLILKMSFDTKPWESGIIDTVNVWKFNVFDYSPLMLIADFLDLKKTVDLDTHIDLSRYYWKNIGEKPEETLKYISLQSATQTNLVIQLINELRLA